MIETAINGALIILVALAVALPPLYGPLWLSASATAIVMVIALFRGRIRNTREALLTQSLQIQQDLMLLRLSVSDLFFGPAIVATAYSMWRGGTGLQPSTLKKPFALLLVAFAVAIPVGIAATGHLSTWALLNRAVGLLSLIGSFVVLARFVTSVTAAIQAARYFILGTGIANAAALVVAAAAFAGLENQSVYLPSSLRMYGWVGNPSLHGGLLMTASLLELGLLAAPAPRDPRTFLRWVNVTLMGVGLVLTVSRSAWLAVGVGAAVLLGVIVLRAPRLWASKPLHKLAVLACAVAPAAALSTILWVNLRQGMESVDDRVTALQDLAASQDAAAASLSQPAPSVLPSPAPSPPAKTPPAKRLPDPAASPSHSAQRRSSVTSSAATAQPAPPEQATPNTPVSPGPATIPAQPPPTAAPAAPIPPLTEAAIFVPVRTALTAAQQAVREALHVERTRFASSPDSVDSDAQTQDLLQTATRRVADAQERLRRRQAELTAADPSDPLWQWYAYRLTVIAQVRESLRRAGDGLDKLHRGRQANAKTRIAVLEAELREIDAGISRFEARRWSTYGRPRNEIPPVPPVPAQAVPTATAAAPPPLPATSLGPELVELVKPIAPSTSPEPVSVTRLDPSELPTAVPSAAVPSATVPSATVPSTAVAQSAPRPAEPPRSVSITPIAPPPDGPLRIALRPGGSVMNARGLLDRSAIQLVAWNSYVANWRTIVFGIGLGTFLTVSEAVVGFPLIIHSTFVWFLVELGPLGLVALLWVWWRTLVNLWRASAVSDRRRELAHGALGAFAAMTIFWLLNEGFYQRQFWLVLLLADRMALLPYTPPESLTEAPAA